MVVRILTVLIACFSVFAFASAKGSEREGVLDHLFDVLSSTANADQAAAAEQAIWTLWFYYDGDRAPLVSQMMRRGEAAMGRRSLDEAIAAFDIVVDVAPGFAEGWNRRATARYLAGDYAGSVADIQAVLALEPRHFGALAGLGLCLIALDQPRGAVDAFEAALAVNPHLEATRARLETLREELAGAPI